MVMHELRMEIITKNTKFVSRLEEEFYGRSYPTKKDILIKLEGQKTSKPKKSICKGISVRLEGVELRKAFKIKEVEEGYLHALALEPETIIKLAVRPIIGLPSLHLRLY